MAAKIALVSPVVNSYQVHVKAYAVGSAEVTLDNTITGSTPISYMASESATFDDAYWQPYTKSPVFTLNSGNGMKTIYFKVQDGSLKQSAVVYERIWFNKGRILYRTNGDFGTRG